MHLEPTRMNFERGTAHPGTGFVCVRLRAGEAPCVHGSGGAAQLYPGAPACVHRSRETGLRAAALQARLGPPEWRIPEPLCSQLASLLPRDVLACLRVMWVAGVGGFGRGAVGGGPVCCIGCRGP